MTAGQRVVAQPAFQGRAAALLLASTFVVGVATGLLAPLVHLTPSHQAVTSSPDPATAAWSSYREGERALPVIASEVGDRTWRSYRQGERTALAAGGPSADSFQLYRAGERQSLPAPATVSSVDPWQLYRAGERGDRAP